VRWITSPVALDLALTGGGRRGLRGQAKPTQQEQLHQGILDTFKHVGTVRGTARKVGCARATVRKVLRRGRRKRPITYPGTRPSKLDPYRAVIQRLVVEDQLTGVLVLEEIKKLGYAGGHSILDEYIRRIRPKPKVRVTTVVEHPPGADYELADAMCSSTSFAPTSRLAPAGIKKRQAHNRPE